jgi:hypothetical protein
MLSNFFLSIFLIHQEASRGLVMLELEEKITIVHRSYRERSIRIAVFDAADEQIMNFQYFFIDKTSNRHTKDVTTAVKLFQNHFFS